MEEWPLIGRESELEHLRALVLDPTRSGAVVAAPEGTGKTRLALECLECAAQQGFTVARITATVAASQVPLGAVAPLLPAAPPSEPPVQERSELLLRSVQAVTSQASGPRLVLLVDDAHLLDSLSATLVHQLALTNTAFVLLTVRAGEPVPDPIVALWKDGVIDRLEIGALSAEAILELLERVLGAQVDRRAAAHLAVRSHGNVLFLRELVLGALEDETLRARDGLWRMSGSPTPSSRLIELVETRIGRIEPNERELMELLAFGEPIGTAQVERLTDPDVVEHLERAALVTTRIDGQRLEVRLAHPTYGDVVRARTPAIRARTIARILAESVEQSGARRREDVLRIGSWRLTAGGGRPDLMLAAALTARWRYDFPLAERLANAAVQGGAGFDARLLVAKLAMLQGRGDEAEATLGQLATEAADDEQRARVAAMRLDIVIWSIGASDRASEIADRAEAEVGDPRWRDEIIARRAFIAMLARDRWAEALELSEALLERATGQALALACQTAAFCVLRQGRVHDALELSARGEAAQEVVAAPMDRYPWVHRLVLSHALHTAGRLDEAEVVLEAEYAKALVDDSPEAQATFAMELARLNALRGRVRTSLAMAQEATAVFRQLGQHHREREGIGRAAMAYALVGMVEAAARALDEVDALRVPGAAWSLTEDAEARAWVRVALGDLPAAREGLRAAALVQESTDDLPRAAAAWHTLARLGGAAEASDRLGGLAKVIEGELTQVRALHAQGLTRRDAEALSEASARFAAMGTNLFAAEAAADAAVCVRRAGDSRKAAALERQAVLLADRCEGARTPALQSITARSQLTPAERDTALLAAAGRSNRDIADELSVSVRTVESRLQSTYSKLGIAGRQELADALALLPGEH